MVNKIYVSPPAKNKSSVKKRVKIDIGNMDRYCKKGTKLIARNIMLKLNAHFNQFGQLSASIQ